MFCQKMLKAHRRKHQKIIDKRANKFSMTPRRTLVRLSSFAAVGVLHQLLLYLFAREE
jgi:hypothetical protein